MTLSVVEISAYSAVGRSRRWRGIGYARVVVCNGRALSGPQTERRRARRPSAPHDATAAATRQPALVAAAAAAADVAPLKRRPTQNVSSVGFQNSCAHVTGGVILLFSKTYAARGIATT